MCPTCRGDGFHPMAPHPRTPERLAGNECPECRGVDEPVSTMSNSLPNPTRSVTTAIDYLTETVDKDMGTKNGRTALGNYLGGAKARRKP